MEYIIYCVLYKPSAGLAMENSANFKEFRFGIIFSWALRIGLDCFTEIIQKDNKEIEDLLDLK